MTMADAETLENEGFPGMAECLRECVKANSPAIQRFDCHCGWSGPVSACVGNECPECGWKSQGTFPKG